MSCSGLIKKSNPTKKFAQMKKQKQTKDKKVGELKYGKSLQFRND